jgi:DNA polymerase elongation subunit (family B)
MGEMAFHIDHLADGRLVRWHRTAEGVTHTVDPEYTPRFYVGPRRAGASLDLQRLLSAYEQHPQVAGVSREQHRIGFRDAPSPVIAVDATHVEHISTLARLAHDHAAAPVGDVACYNVDLSREFRYCLETGTDPTPSHPLRQCTLDVAPTDIADGTLETLTVDGTTVTGATAIAETVAEALTTADPDILVCSTAAIVPALAALADRTDLQLSRLSDAPVQQLAGRSTYDSYGRVGHSPARYNIPGRVIIDRSNTFFHRETNLDGMVDLVSRSWKPLQELAWASIGNVLTAMQIRAATARDVLTPWHPWRPEFYKSMRTLHAADRGGFIFAPDPGFHETVYELDFSSLYPNIICTHNISPDVIRCDCHADRSDVPELGYAVCDRRGYLVDVLEPLIADRDAIKAEIAALRAADDADADHLAELEGRSSALKWILVACFGYQGFNNAKFGRIECHEAINAHAREILLTAKEQLEAGGWTVVHGIVDSIWVTPRDGVDQTDLATVAASISAAVGIRLEYEAAYDWVAFVPRTDGAGGTLTRYFGKRADGSGFKLRGIEARQRSTPPLIAEFQHTCLERLDATRDPDAVLALLLTQIDRLAAGVDPGDLVIRTRVSQPAEAYTQRTHTVAALERAAAAGLEVHPGEDVRFVVVDDAADSADRVALAHEPIDRYDVAFYRDQLVRATASILRPLGMDAAAIRAALADTRELPLSHWNDC